MRMTVARASALLQQAGVDVRRINAWSFWEELLRDMNDNQQTFAKGINHQIVLAQNYGALYATKLQNSDGVTVHDRVRVIKANRRRGVLQVQTIGGAWMRVTRGTQFEPG